MTEQEKFKEFYNIVIRPLEEENQRLRKALEEIAYLDSSNIGILKSFVKMKIIARQAIVEVNGVFIIEEEK